MRPARSSYKILNTVILTSSFALLSFLAINGHFSGAFLISSDPKTEEYQSDEVDLQQQQEHHHSPRMSCFSCSTMDYESPTDNICRMLKQQNDISKGQLLRLAEKYKQISSPVTITEEDLFPTKYQRQRQTNRDKQERPTGQQIGKQFIERQISSVTEDYSTVALAEAKIENGSTMSVGLGPTRRYVNSTTVSTKSAISETLDNEQSGASTFDSLLATTTTTPTTQSTATLPARRPVVQNNRSILPNNSIRIRPCMEDENFCSIVSVVRLEFVQDNLYSKFWALERNCSKSCNTGCMLIGERVRLRVCSQCCRSGNCNIGSGTSSSIRSTDSTYSVLLVLSIFLALILNNFDFKHKIVVD